VNDSTPKLPQETPVGTGSDQQPESSSADKPERKRPKLNPTGGDSARAIPSRTKPVATQAEGEPTVEERLADVAAEVAKSPTESPEPPPKSQQAAAPPVDLPPDDDLDAEIEAEIEAALASDDAKLLDLAAQAVSSIDGENEAAAPERIESEEDLEEGSRLKGTIQAIDADNVFVDIGMRANGIVPRRQWDKSEPEVGQVIDVAVERYDADEGLIQLNLPRGRRRVGGDWNAVTVGMKCDCIVTKANKGGLEVQVGALRGFLPAGQVDRGYVEDLEPFIGQKLSVEVTEVDSRKRNLVVSRRVLLEEEQKDAATELWQQLNVGEIRSGTVKTLKEYGAFIDLGGLDGFLHIGEISWSRLNHPEQVLTQGQSVEVKILEIDKERSRVSLGMKQLTRDPWGGAIEVYTVGRQVSGTVTRIMDFGAFVELEPGIEGLLHISELEHTRVRKVSDVLSDGQSVDVQILNVDPSQQRISLSLKALTERPAGADRGEAPDDDLPPIERIEPSALKGGTGDSGNLFGNPDDF